MNKKIIIIGTGIAGYGALEAIEELRIKNDVIFYNFGDEIKKKSIQYNIYPKFSMPKKTEFGYSLFSYKIKNSFLKLFYSKTSGGLSDFWSGSISTFSNEELKLRKITFLKKYYDEFAKKINVLGDNKKIKNFKNIQSNYPFPESEKYQKINGKSYQDHKINIQITNNKIICNKTNCTMCGECFNGCPENILFRPRIHFHNQIVINKKINKIKFDGKKWKIYNDDKLDNECDILFLAMGTYQTISLLNNSKLINYKKVEIYDSSTFLFPIKHNNIIKNNRAYYGYANSLITSKGKKDKKYDTQISIVPFNNFFTYRLFGKYLGKYLENFFNKNFSIGMFFSSKTQANVFSINNKNNLKLKQNNMSIAKKQLRKLIQIINKNFSFRILNLVISNKSSIHYSSNLLNEKEDFFTRSEYKKNLFVIDGNIFPGKPIAQGNSYSIMCGSFAIVKNKLMMEHKN